MSEIVKRASGIRAKKRKFNSNRYTTKSCDAKISSSSKKLKTDALPIKEVNARLPNFNGYRVIDINLLFNFIQKNLSCKCCGGNVALNESSVNGLASKFEMQCDCSLKEFNSCQLIGQKKNVPEVNRRFVYSMRMLGKGRAGMQVFCCGMDLPPPMAQKSYTMHVNRILRATKETAICSMRKAAQTEAILTNSSLSITVSGDGTWKTRGHTSLTGVCSVIGSESGKVIDTQVMSSYCKKCEHATNSKSLETHESCLRNHFGSAGKMEVDGMLQIFQRSEETRSVKYTKYIGDGDCKTFTALCNAKPYGSALILEKIECVGHIQKRMGTRLRKLKQERKKEKLMDGKTLCGKGRLTDKLINELTTYFGNAIRQHKDSLVEMRKAIWAIYYHKISTDENPVHEFCPNDSHTWCKYNKYSSQEDIAYHHKNPIPVAVMKAIKPIFKDLSQPSLLKRCLGGKTQNSNESFNSLIWKFCPKTSGAGSKIVQIATNEATVLFNDGCDGRHQTMDSLQLLRSAYSIDGFKYIDNKRIIDAERKAAMNTKEQRKLNRSLKTAIADDLEAREGHLYAAGAF